MRNFIRFGYGVLDVVRASINAKQISFVADTPLSLIGVNGENLDTLRTALESAYSVTLLPFEAERWNTVGDVCNALDSAHAHADPGGDEEAAELFPDEVGD